MKAGTVVTLRPIDPVPERLLRHSKKSEGVNLKACATEVHRLALNFKTLDGTLTLAVSENDFRLGIHFNKK